jgi:hypothetical protein
MEEEQTADKIRVIQFFRVELPGTVICVEEMKYHSKILVANSEMEV